MASWMRIKVRDEDERKTIRGHLYEAWRPADPKVALQATLTWDADDYETQQVQETVLEGWSARARPDAARWVESLLPGQMRDQSGGERRPGALE